MPAHALSAAHTALLRELDRRGELGALTSYLARFVWTAGTPADRATNRLRTMARAGLVARHPHNVERWLITPAGRTRLQEGI